MGPTDCARVAFTSSLTTATVPRARPRWPPDHAANPPCAALTTSASIGGNPEPSSTNYSRVHRPASRLDASLIEELAGCEDLTVEDQERIARLSNRLRAQVNLRRVLDLVADLPPISGEFDA